MLLFFLAEKDSYFTPKHCRKLAVFRGSLSVCLAQIRSGTQQRLRFVSSIELNPLHGLLLECCIRSCGMSLWVWGTHCPHSSGFWKTYITVLQLQVWLTCLLSLFLPLWLGRQDSHGTCIYLGFGFP